MVRRRSSERPRRTLGSDVDGSVPPAGQGAQRGSGLRGRGQVRDGVETGDTADQYVRITVLLASVLFILGINSQFRLRSARVGLISVGVVILLYRSCSGVGSASLLSVVLLRAGCAGERILGATRPAPSGAVCQKVVSAGRSVLIGMRDRAGRSSGSRRSRPRCRCTAAARWRWRWRRSGRRRPGLRLRPARHNPAATRPNVGRQRRAAADRTTPRLLGAVPVGRHAPGRR